MRSAYFAILLSIGLLPSASFALECETNEDCPEGYECLMSRMIVECDPKYGDACPGFLDAGECIEGTPAGPEDGGAGKEYWLGIPCSADAECPSGFLCREVSLDCGDNCPRCACPTCKDDKTCPQCLCESCEGSECVGLSMHICIFNQYDCGPKVPCWGGLVCMAKEKCELVEEKRETGFCPWGATDCASEASSETSSATEECETQWTYCGHPLITCASDSDCADGWTCQSDYQGEPYCLAPNWELLGIFDGEISTGGSPDFEDVDISFEEDTKPSRTGCCFVASTLARKLPGSGGVPIAVVLLGLVVGVAVFLRTVVSRGRSVRHSELRSPKRVPGPLA